MYETLSDPARYALSEVYSLNLFKETLLRFSYVNNALELFFPWQLLYLKIFEQ